MKVGIPTIEAEDDLVPAGQQAVAPPAAAGRRPRPPVVEPAGRTGPARPSAS